jgi:hypothetical protein
MDMLKDLHQYTEENIELERKARKMKDDQHTAMISDLWEMPHFMDEGEDAK